jgi:hypothetical protein
MRPTFVTLRYSRVFPYPLDATYQWLTDYQDDDPARTDRVVKRRPVLKREPGKVTMEGELELFGSFGAGKVEVTLDPPAHYVANIVEGRGRGCVFDYRLTPVAGGTRLDVDYRIRVKRWRSRLRVALGKPLLRREIHRMWEGFAASMGKDLGAPVATAARERVG